MMETLMGLVLSVCLLAVPVTGVETNCTFRTTGTSGQLICQLSTNINGLYNFLVHRYDQNGSTENVLQCWVQVGQRLHCFVSPGYEFDKNVWNMLVIDIPTLSQRHSGKYICQVLGNGETKDNPCFYNYSGGSAVVSSTVPASVTQHSTKEDKDAVLLDHSTAQLLLLSILLIAVLVTLSVCLYLWKRRGVGTDGRNAQPNSSVQNGPIPNPHATNDADLQQRLCNMEQEIQKIHTCVYQMTTDTTATLLKQLQNLSATQDNNKSSPRGKSVSGDEDETLHKAEVTDHLLSQPSSSR